MKYLILFLTISFACKKSGAQYYVTHKPDTLRWFVGKWIDKKTFKIDSTLSGKGGGGGKITVGAGGTIEVSSPGKKAFDDNMDQSITKIEKEEQDIAAANKQSEGMYQFSLTDEIIKELEKVKADFKALRNAETAAPPPAKSANALQFEKSCTEISAEYKRVVGFYKAHKGEKDPHFNLPAPPVADYFNCWGCDSAKRIEFDTLSAQYVRDFFTEERSAINFLLGKIQMMDATGIGGIPGDNVDRDLKDAFDSTRSHHGPCSYISYYDMSRAVEFYFRRGMQKVKQLWEDNAHNYGAFKPVMTVCLGAYQQQCAMGGITLDDLTGHMAEMAKPIEHLYDTMTDLLITQRDYRLIGTIPFMIGAYQNIIGFATHGIMNGEIQWGDDYPPKHTIEELTGFPHFELTLELETKLGDNGKYVIMHLKSTSKLNAELDDKECVKFILSKDEHDKIIAKGTQTIISNGVSTNESTNTAPAPVFKIHFCPVPGIPDGDSIFLAILTPRTTDMLFVNVEQMKTDLPNIDPEANKKQLEDIQKNALDMQEKLKQMQASGADPLKMAEMVKKMMNNVNGVVKTQAAEILRVRLPLTVNNMSKDVVNQRINAKDVNAYLQTEGIVYAYLTIKITHTPLH